MTNKGNKLQQLRAEMKEALMQRRYTRVANLQQKIKAELQRREQVPLSIILPEMTEEQMESQLMKMHKVFVVTDMLYGYALEFEEDLKKFDPSMELLVVRQVKEIVKISREITKNVDAFHCKHLSENFGNMCDECSLVLENIIYRYRQREKKEIEERKKKK